MIERPLRLGAARNRLAIATEPWHRRDSKATNSGTGVLFLSSGPAHRIGPSRLFTRAARILARAGFPTLRMDLAGVGDSDWSPGAATQRESTCADAKEAIDALVLQGARDGIVLVGLGVGAREALWAASEDDRVCGVVLVDGPAFRTRRFHLRRLREALVHPRSCLRALGRRFARSRSDSALAHTALHTADGRPEFGGVRPSRGGRAEIEGEFRRVMEKGVSVFAIYTGSLTNTVNDDRQFLEMFPDLSRRGCTRSLRLPHADGHFSVVSEQDELIEHLVRWARQLARTKKPDASSPSDRPSASAPPSIATH